MQGITITLRQKIILFFGLGAICIMLYFLSQAYYDDYKLAKQVEYFTEQNKKMEKTIIDMKDKVIYYMTPNYKDKYAKEILNKLNPGEKVIIITPDPKSPEEIEKALEDIPVTVPIKQTPFESWKIYFFGEDDISKRE